MNLIPADKPLEKELLPLFTQSISFQIPATWKDFLVKVIPWLLVLMIPIYIISIGLNSIGSLFSAFSAHLLASLAMLFVCLGLICNLLSLSGMFKRQRQGWVYNYYAFLFSLSADLFYLQFIEAILSFLFFGYLLFQIRSYYK